MQVPKPLSIHYLELGEYNEINYTTSTEIDGYVYMNNNMIDCFINAQLNYTNVKEISILINDTPYTLVNSGSDETEYVLDFIDYSETYSSQQCILYGFERVNFNSDEPNQFYINTAVVEPEHSGTPVTIKFVSIRTDDAIYYIQ